MTFAQHLTRVRESEWLIVLVVFVAFMLDLLTVATTVPILPMIIAQIYNCSEIFNDAPTIDPSNKTEAAGDTFMDVDIKNMSSECQDLEKQLPTLTGIVLSVGPVFEILANIPIAFFVNRFSHKIPLLLGIVLNAVATLCFAFVPNYGLLIATKICQSLGSIVSIVAGLAMLASRITDDKARSKAMGRAVIGISVGVVLGYPFGTALFQFYGRTLPYIIIAALLLFDGGLRLLVKEPAKTEKEEALKLAHIGRMLTDIDLLAALYEHFIANFVLAAVVALVPMWMVSELGAEIWQTGTIACIALVIQSLIQFICSSLAPTAYRWLFFMAAYSLMAIGIGIYIISIDVWFTLLPECIFRASQGIVLCLASPMLSCIVDARHNSNYSPAFALYTATHDLGLLLGPLLQGYTTPSIGYMWTFIILSCLALTGLPVSLVLRRFSKKMQYELKKLPPAKVEIERGEQIICTHVEFQDAGASRKVDNIIRNG